MKRSFLKTEYLAALGLLVFCLLLLAVGTVQARYFTRETWNAQLLPIKTGYADLTEEGRHFALRDWQTDGETLGTRTLTLRVAAGEYDMSGEINCYTEARGNLAIMNAFLSGAGLETVEGSQILTLSAGTQTELTLTLQTAYPSVEEDTWVTAFVNWLPEFGGVQKLLRADCTVWLLPPEPVGPLPTEQTPAEPTEEPAAEPAEDPERSEEPAPETPAEPAEQTPTEEPTEPAEQAGESGEEGATRKRSVTRSMHLVSEAMESFAPDGSFAMRLTPPPGTETFLLENRGDASGMFPAGTEYSTNLGETWYRLYEADKILLRRPGEELWLLLRFSGTDAVQAGSELLLFASAHDGESALMTQELRAVADNELPRALTEGLRLLDGRNSLEVSLTGDWDAGLWQVGLEKLIMTAGHDLAYVPIEAAANHFSFEQSGGKLLLHCTENETPAGTYRMVLKLEYREAVVSKVEIPFFVAYRATEANN